MDWNNLYIRHPEFRIKEPAEEVVDFVPLVEKISGAAKDKKILDLGFGAGRHVVYLAKKGYDMYGTDISESGLHFTKKGLDEENLSADLKLSDMTKIPYGDNFFDAIINRGVITHNTKSGVEKCIDEMYRALKPSGLVMTTFISTESSEYGKGELVAPQTFKPTEGPEEGVVHYFTQKSDVEQMMSSFEPIKIYHYRHEGILNIGNYVSAHWIYVGRKPKNES